MCCLLNQIKPILFLSVTMFIFPDRPNDSRMLVALGESYERLDKIAESKKCYWRAYSVGDVEGVALVKLAR